MKTQIQLEEEMSLRAQARADRMEGLNEEMGEASRNPYGGYLASVFTKPLHDIIVEDIQTSRSGSARVMGAALVYLQQIDARSAAFIAVRKVVNECIRNDLPGNFRAVVSQIGRLIQYEKVLGEIKSTDVRMFNTVKNALQERSQQKPKQIMSSMTKEAKKRGINPERWPSGAYEYVGAYLVGRLVQLGLCEVSTHTEFAAGRNGKKRIKKVQTLTLTADVYDRIVEIKDLSRERMPFYLPCVEKPIDWTSVDEGGFHTFDMRKMASTAILGGSHGGDNSKVLECLNILQSVPWSINHDVLDVAMKMQTVEDGEEIVSSQLPDPPPKPQHLEGKNKKDLVGQEKDDHTQWRFKMAEYGLALRARQQKIGRMSSVFDVANAFKDYPELYFVYHADFRGRVYPYTTGPNPQGSDLQKGVLQFANAKPIKSEEGQKWFMYQGANKFGVDKLPLDEKLQWVADNHDLFVKVATDPVKYRDMWYTCDSPFQFLAWCFEYKRFCEEGPAFVSRLPISMDGSCNGLQNFSALLLDEVGGAATNLVPQDKPADIYMLVAEMTRQFIEKLPEDDARMRSKWLAHGIKRGAVKRSVMTLPYGSTRYSARNFILDDYLRKVKPAEFEVWEYKTAAQYLSEVLWEAIGQVVVKAREAMDLLQNSAKKIMKTEQVISWDTPTGFRVQQKYKGYKRSGKIMVDCMGGIQFNISTDAKQPDVVRHKNGLSPNFIHSMDASHMALVSIQAAREGIKCLAMIHDDFGTYADDTPRLAQIIREQFVGMYEGTDWLGRFHQQYTDIGVDLDPMPAHGNLDIKRVLDSQYFFA